MAAFSPSGDIMDPEAYLAHMNGEENPEESMMAASAAASATASAAASAAASEAVVAANAAASAKDNTRAVRLLSALISLLNKMQYDTSLCRNPQAVDVHGARVVEMVLDPALEPFWDVPITRDILYMMGGSGKRTFRLVSRKEKKKYDLENEQLVIFVDGGVPEHDVGMDGWDGSTPDRGWTRGNETLGWHSGKISQLKKLKAMVETRAI